MEQYVTLRHCSYCTKERKSRCTEKCSPLPQTSSSQHVVTLLKARILCRPQPTCRDWGNHSQVGAEEESGEEEEQGDTTREWHRVGNWPKQ